MLCSGSTQRKDPLRVYSVKDTVCWHFFLSAFTNQTASCHYTQEERTYYILLDLIELIIRTVNKAEKTYCFWRHQKILNVLIPKDLAVFFPHQFVNLSFDVTDSYKLHIFAPLWSIFSTAAGNKIRRGMGVNILWLSGQLITIYISSALTQHIIVVFEKVNVRLQHLTLWMV